MIAKKEKEIIGWLEKNIVVIFFIVVTALAVVIRGLCINEMSGDMANFLLPWYEKLKENGGFRALALQLGDYNVPYVFILACLTYLPIPPMYAIKIVSIIFDFLLALSVGILIYYESGKKKYKAVLGYTFILFSPIVVFNSAFWGQCDALYSTFIILAIICIMKDKEVLSFILLGCAFAFKLQFIFILPVFCVIYFRKKSFSVLYFLLIPVTNLVLCLPAMIAGRPVADVISIYMNQTATYPHMTMNYPNLYAVIGDYYEQLHTLAIIFTVIILGIGAFLVLYKKIKINYQNIIGLSIWSVWTCVMFLPAMHERYGFLLESLLIVNVLLYQKEIATALMVQVIIFYTYTMFLLGSSGQLLPYLGIINFILYLWFTIRRFRELTISSVCNETN